MNAKYLITSIIIDKSGTRQDYVLQFTKEMDLEVVRKVAKGIRIGILERPEVESVKTYVAEVIETHE